MPILQWHLCPVLNLAAEINVVDPAADLAWKLGSLGGLRCRVPLLAGACRPWCLCVTLCSLAAETSTGNEKLTVCPSYRYKGVTMGYSIILSSYITVAVAGAPCLHAHIALGM